jgi:hypothetical protein
MFGLGMQIAICFVSFFFLGTCHHPNASVSDIDTVLYSNRLVLTSLGVFFSCLMMQLQLEQDARRTDVNLQSIGMTFTSRYARVQYTRYMFRVNASTRLHLSAA